MAATLVEFDCGTGESGIRARLGEPVFCAVMLRSGWLPGCIGSFANEISFCVGAESISGTFNRRLTTSPAAAERKPPRGCCESKVSARKFSEPPSLMNWQGSRHPSDPPRARLRQFERCTVGDYVREVRIEYTRQRMLGTSEALVDIALAAGFADQTHFTRSFKRVTGMTPAEFRRIFAQR